MSTLEGTSVARAGAPASVAHQPAATAQPFSLVVPLFNEARRFSSAAGAFAEFIVMLALVSPVPLASALQPVNAYVMPLSFVAPVCSVAFADEPRS